MLGLLARHWAEAYPAMARVGRAAEKLQDAAAEMALVATVVEATSQPMARRDPLRKHMDLIYQEVSATPRLPWACTQEAIRAQGKTSGCQLRLPHWRSVLQEHFAELHEGGEAVKP